MKTNPKTEFLFFCYIGLPTIGVLIFVFYWIIAFKMGRGMTQSLVLLVPMLLLMFSFGVAKFQLMRLRAFFPEQLRQQIELAGKRSTISILIQSFVWVAIVVVCSMYATGFFLSGDQFVFGIIAGGVAIWAAIMIIPSARNIFLRLVE